MTYRHLDRDGVDRWIKELKSAKGSGQQVDFLTHVAKDSPADFVRHVESCIGAGRTGSAYEDPSGEVPSLLVGDQPIFPITAGHMYLMPAENMISLYQHWKEIPYGEAACSTLWGSITLAEIQAGRIQPSWLAVDRNGDEERARTEIDQAIRDCNKKKIDTLVRRVLRWMMGPGHFRGSVELYGNCALAKAWWCGCLSHMCATHGRADGSLDEISKALKEVWLELADYLSGKLTVISEPNVVEGIALWANERLQDGTHLPRKHVKQACLRLGVLSSWCALGLKSPGDIQAELQRLQLDMPSVGATG